MRLGHDTEQGAFRKRVICFIDEVLHAAPLIVVANEAEEARDAAHTRSIDEAQQRTQVERVGGDSGRAHSNIVAIPVSFHPSLRVSPILESLVLPEVSERLMTVTNVGAVTHRAGDVLLCTAGGIVQ